MKSFISAALFGAVLVAAVPAHERRDIKWHTTWTATTKTVWSTSTVWVEPSSSSSSSSSPIANPGAVMAELGHTYSAPVAPPSPPPTTTSSPPPPPPPPPAPTPTPPVAVPAPAPKPAAPKPSPKTYTPAPAAAAPAAAAAAPVPAAASPKVYTPPVSTPAAPHVNSGATSQNGGGSSSAPSNAHSGIEMTFYTPGMGSCGVSNTDGDAIVALAAPAMHASFSGANPNANPLCGKSITIKANGVTKTAKIMDTCPGCVGPDDLDLSPSLFQAFAAESVGRIKGAEWWFN